MANSENERAKAELAAREMVRRSLESASLVLPANYNANFRLHKREWDVRRRDAARWAIDAQNRAAAMAQGIPLPPPSTTRPEPVHAQVNALPGFLAARPTAEQRREPRVKEGMMQATDDRYVDRFIKRRKRG